MANESFLNKSQETNPTGLRFWGKKPDGVSPTGFIDVWITFENLISSTLSSMATVAANLALLVARVVVLENTISKRVDLNKNASYNFALNDTDHVLSQIIIKRVSGSPTVKVGTTSGGKEIIESVTLTSVDNIKLYSLDIPFDGLTDIYVTITSGSVNIAITYMPNIFNS